MRLVFIISSILSFINLHAQIRVSGTVYDASRSRPLEAVSVLSTSGQGSTTDSSGRYIILVKEEDSIYFSFLNKPTGKFPVRSIPNIFQFDISLHVPVTDLPMVKVKLPNYKRDSIQNRMDYRKAFDFRKPGIGITSAQGGAGIGLDLDEFISIFRFRQNRRMLAFQKRLLQEEEDKFIDHRFTRGIVKEITGLAGDSLTRFMKEYRPSYEFTQLSNDYEFLEYIKLAWLQFIQPPAFRREHFN